MSPQEPTILTGHLGAPSLNVTKVNIATPAYRSQYSGLYVKSLYSLLTTAPRHKIQFSFSDIDYADIVTSRNYLVSNFYYLKQDCQYLLFLDSDMGFEHDLIYDMLSLKADVVGVVYPKRSFNAQHLHANSKQDFQRAYAEACTFIGEPKTKPDAKGFCEVSSCGTGIFLISRASIERMIGTCPEIVDEKRFKRMPYGAKFEKFLTPFEKIKLEDRELSEDVSFCYRWTSFCKGTILANVTRRVQHLGELVIDTHYSQKM